MKKILVLGSNSFAGSVFVDECLNADMNVVGVNRSPEQHDAFLPAPGVVASPAGISLADSAESELYRNRSGGRVRRRLGPWRCVVFRLSRASSAAMPNTRLFLAGGTTVGAGPVNDDRNPGMPWEAGGS